MIGSAGTGKSYLVRCIMKSLPLETTFVTAATGVAATAIQGTTIHFFAGISAGEGK
jgi:ATP-dependent DNA helicase PIF1